MRSACEQNADLSERVLWSLSVDWARTRGKFGPCSQADLLFRAALCWEWWAVAHYRFAYWVHKRVLPEVGRGVWRWVLVLQQAALLRICYLLGRVTEGLSGARLSALAEVGPGLLLPHTGSCGIASSARIGHTFTLYQDANVMGGRQGQEGPSIGDGVTLFSGARVLGSVHVGDGVQVGANALVMHDLPAGCVALGLPAKPVGSLERPAPYRAEALLRDALQTLVSSGQLVDRGGGVYVDPGTGREIRIEMEPEEPSGA